MSRTYAYKGPVRGGRRYRASRAGKYAGSKARKGVKATARAAALQVLNQRTGGFMGIETKFLDCSLAAEAIAAANTWAVKSPGAGCVDSISVPEQGDGEQERDGRCYVIKSIHVQGFLIQPAEEAQPAPPDDIYVRLCLYWDTQTNGAVAAPTDIMELNAVNDLIAYRNLENTKRFIVLFDRTYKLSAQTMGVHAANTFSAPTRVLKFKINKSFTKGIKVRTSNTTADVANATDNNINIMAVSNSAATTIEYESRVRFVG